MRIFSAINLPKEVHTQVARVSAELQKKARISRITWVKPGSLHVTFHFHGELDTQQLELVKAVYESAAVSIAPVELRLGKLTGLPNSRLPRTIIIEVKTLDPGLSELYKLVSQGLQAGGIKVQREQWTAHITLGRVKSHHFPLPQLHVKELSWRVAEIDLMESHLKPTGPVYKKIASYELAKSSNP